MTADAFLSEKEAIVKNLGINLLNLVFFNQVGEFLGHLAGVQFHGARRFKESKGLF